MRRLEGRLVLVAQVDGADSQADRRLVGEADVGIGGPRRRGVAGREAGEHGDRHDVQAQRA